VAILQKINNYVTLKSAFSNLSQLTFRGKSTLCVTLSTLNEREVDNIIFTVQGLNFAEFDVQSCLKEKPNKIGLMQLHFGR